MTMASDDQARARLEDLADRLHKAAAGLGEHDRREALADALALYAVMRMLDFNAAHDEGRVRHIRSLMDELDRSRSLARDRILSEAEARV